MTGYWFARYRPATATHRAGRGLVPLTWQGRSVIAIFALSLIAGGTALLFFGLRDQMQIGIPAFIVLAIAGAALFLWASLVKTDPIRPAADYIAERGK